MNKPMEFTDEELFAAVNVGDSAASTLNISDIFEKNSSLVTYREVIQGF